MSRRAKILKRLKERRDNTSKVIKKENSIDEIKPKENKNPLLNIYHTQYKKLLLIPLIMFILAIIIMGSQFAITGEFINKAVSLKGGTTITIPTEQIIDINELEKSISQEFNNLEISIRKLARAGKQTGIIIETDIKSTEELQNIISSLNSNIGDLGDYSTEVMGSSLGASFFKETMIALILAFIFMGVVVFLYFRTIVPSLAVMLAAFSDIFVTLAIINLLGIKLSTAGIAAFLMIIGYSVDTDILLTTRMLKRKSGSLNERVMQALETGLTMTITTLAVITLGLIFSQSNTIHQIMLILFIGLFVDMINTWIQNVGILRWYLEKHGKNKENIY